MGAQQSSGSGGTGAPAGVEVKTSYYELLGVERTATDEEIKKAYRKKALELHPDRNYGDIERTTSLFADVQAAYEVLSDKNERAWYDAHERVILRGGEAGTEEAHYEHDIRMTTADDITRMLRKFHGKIDYSDSPSGFFGYLRELFATLAREEEAAADWEGADVVDYPSFGHKDDTYEDVVKQFYNTWTGFSTAKTFSWNDVFRYSEAPDRRVRRMMEKENKRFRDEGIREFNDAVRTMVAFVRKRDPRYTPNTQTDAQREKAQREARSAQAARAKAANEAKLKELVPEWATARDPQDEQEEEEEDIVEEHYECVACYKTFKSEPQYEAHEKSKKHQKAVQLLKRKMQKENQRLNLDSDFSSSGAMTPASMEEADKQDGGGSGTDPVEEDIAEAVNQLKVDGEMGADIVEAAEGGEDNADAPNLAASLPTAKSSDEEDDEYAARSEVEGRLHDLEPEDQDSATQTSSSTPDAHNEAVPPTAKLGKAAQKRAKKAEKQAAALESGLKFQCAFCNAAFPSKTRMFQHIKDFGHATPVQHSTKGARKK
ncbi:DnaJ-domain-containing protein [Lepidopterella palustris CBS 459.81]|uniref:DnaJ-domain-containing protein n=1 Tax=Lepidopterella palustris CBS 459.81 TaxID=1314670 RepID=A0A8E2EI12_9PEZI|nr:DnaJ-domain-containing protein [Lepidopterella palustris CBS 459.81]